MQEVLRLEDQHKPTALKSGIFMNKQAILMLITCLSDLQMETAVWSQMLPAMLKYWVAEFTETISNVLFAKQNNQQINNLWPSSKYKKKT